MRGKNCDTLVLEQAILDIVEERAPITVRGIAYSLFTRGLIPSMEVAHTQRVSRIATAMREEEVLDWEKVVDDSRKVDRPSTWRDPSAIIRVAMRTYRRDFWQDQPTIVEIWSEKSTVQGVLAPVLHEYGVAFRVMKGFGSFTMVKQAAEDSTGRGHQDTVALYIGDWDPSGLWMSERDLPERLDRYGGQVDLKRIALTKADTRGLPGFDVATKSKDPRHQWFVRKYGRHCWELDALNPNALRQRVRLAIWSYIDRKSWEHARQIEQTEVSSMQDFHSAWQDRLRTGG